MRGAGVGWESLTLRHGFGSGGRRGMSVRVEAFQGDPREWDAFVATMPGASGYHDFAWRGILESSFGHTPHYLAATEGGGLARRPAPGAYEEPALR